MLKQWQTLETLRSNGTRITKLDETEAMERLFAEQMSRSATSECPVAPRCPKIGFSRLSGAAAPRAHIPSPAGPNSPSQQLSTHINLLSA